MSFFLKIISLCFTVVALTACQEKPSYNYLVQHPLELKKAVERCQSNESTTTAAECDMVMNAANKTMMLLKEQEENPEKFGEKILMVELEYIKAKTASKQTEQALADLKAKHAPAADIKLAEAKVQLANKAYQDKCDEKRAMLAILSLSTPQ